MTTAAGLQGQTEGFRLEHECVLVTNGACSRVSEPCGILFTLQLSHFENLEKNSSLLPTVEYEKLGFMLNPRNTTSCKMEILSLKKKIKPIPFVFLPTISLRA